MVLITIVMGVYKPTYKWGGPHCTKAHSCSPDGKTPVTDHTVVRVQRLHFHLPRGWKAHHTSLPEVSPGAPGDGRQGAIAKEDLAKERLSGFALKGSLRIIWKKKHRKRWNSKHRTVQKNTFLTCFWGHYQWYYCSLYIYIYMISPILVDIHQLW